MFRQNLKIAYRNIKKNKLFSFINIAGLACGLSVSFIILLFVMHEMTYDKFQKNYDRTYLAYHAGFRGGYTMGAPNVFYDVIKNKVPGIKKLAQVGRTWDDDYIIKNNEYININEIYFADSEIFDILSFDFIYGSPKSFSSDINSVLISESSLEKYFPANENVIGRFINLHSGSSNFLVKIDGVFKDVPASSHFRPDFIINIEAVRQANPGAVDGGDFNPNCYILMNENSGIKETEKAINAIVNASVPENLKEKYFLLPLAGLHFNDLGLHIGQGGNLKKLFIISGIGILILLMACFNFINLSTAGAAARAKEIGVRKTIGASRKVLMGQFLTESVLMAFIAFPLAIIFTEVFTPIASELLNRTIAANYFTDWKYLGAVFGLVTLTGLFSGSYYAFTISKFNPANVLSKQANFSSSKAPFRRILITFQFVVFTGMIICSLVMYSQMEYLSDVDLGYKKENVLNLKNHYNKDPKQQAFKQALSQIPGVQSVSVNSTTPPFIGNILFYIFKEPSENKEYHINLIKCDENYFNTLGLRLVKGDFFTKEDVNNLSDKAVINEAAAKVLGIKENGYIENKTGEPWHVIGIVKDFNMDDLHGQIAPMILRPGNDFLVNYTLKVDGPAIRETMKKIQEKWGEFYPELPFEYKFLDEEYDARYKDDIRLSRMISLFTGVALFIAMIGLFGISVYSASQRMKEIGIRKVFGASVRQLVFMLNKEVLIISVIGSLIAFPFAYYLMNKWLETFAYKIELGYGIFGVAFVLSLLVGFAAVSSQAFRAAAANPINSIKAE